MRLRTMLDSGHAFTVGSAAELQNVAKTFMDAGRFKDAGRILEKGLMHFSPRRADGNTAPAYALLRALASLCLRMGEAKKCLDLIGDAMHQDRELLLAACEAMAMSGAGRQAIKILELSPLTRDMKTVDFLSHKAWLCGLGGSLAEEETYCREMFRRVGDLSEKQGVLRHLAFLLDARGKTGEALDVVDRFLADSGAERPQYLHSAYVTAAMLTLRLGAYGEMPGRLEKCFASIREPYAAGLYFWLAGACEQLGQTDNAMAALDRSASTASASASRQQGLLLIRRKIHDSSLRAAKKAAYEYLRVHAEPVSLFFDKDWYAQRYGTLLAESDLDPLQHFLHYGVLLGLDPCPCINSAFYFLANPDIFYIGFDPVWHYITCSPYEGRQPSLLFNPRVYMARHSGPDWEQMNPLLHFLLQKGKTQECFRGGSA